jgi:hypothetical protein
MDEGRHRVGAMVELLSVLREFGVDPGALLRSIGLPLHALDEPEGALTFPEVGRLLQACVAATRCEHFGHLVGGRSNSPAWIWSAT